MSNKSLEYVYGLHAVHNLLQYQPERAKGLYLSRQAGQKNHTLLTLSETLGLSIQTAGKDKLDKMSEGGVHQGVVACCSKLPLYSEKLIFDLIESRDTPINILILDGIQDPQNLGACLRTANAMSIDAIVMPRDRAVGLTPVVQKAACGAAGQTPVVQVTNLARFMKQLQELRVWLVGLDVKGESPLSAVDLSGSVAIVMGGEGSGLRRLTQKHCDFVAHIPMTGNMASLNISVATGIALYELQQQRKV